MAAGIRGLVNQYGPFLFDALRSWGEDEVLLLIWNVLMIMLLISELENMFIDYVCAMFVIEVVWW